MRFTLFSFSLLTFVSLSSQSFSSLPIERRVVRRQESTLGSAALNSSALNSTTLNSTVPSSPCQYVSNIYAKSPDAFIPATVAYNCLISMPFNATIVVSFVKEFKKYIEFQSTLAFLADPPKTVQGRRKPVDLLGGLDEILETASKNGYANHYEFEIAISILLRSTHDGHLYWGSNCLDGIFGFGHGFYMISLADSPEDITPKIYEFFEVDSQLYHNITLPYNISAVSAIDDVPVHQYLSDWIEENDPYYHDPDARWNSLFMRRSGGFALGEFNIISNRYLGDSLKITFANGTERTVQWRSQIMANFTGITSGEDLLKYCLTPLATPTADPTPAPTEPPSPPPDYVEGYPEKPLDISSHGDISVYNIGKTGIMAIHYFSPQSGTFKSYQDFVKKTIARFKQMGIERVIIDVTGNPGGFIFLGYDFFKQFFPDVDPFAATNMRAHPALKVLMETNSDQFTNSSLTEAQKETSRLAVVSPYYILDIDGKPFQNWEDLYGPVEIHGDNFTNLARWNLRDSRAFGANITITNGDMKNSTYKAPWAAENIIIVGDGTCSSACSSVVEEMREAGVRTFAYGGRPQRGPMQLTGGVRGGLFGYFYNIKELAQTLGVKNHPEKAAEWSKFLPGPLNIPAFPDFNFMGLNLYNSFGRNDTKTPREFVYEPADFRVQMTKDYLRDMNTLWKDVIDRVWPDAVDSGKRRRV